MSDPIRGATRKLGRAITSKPGAALRAGNAEAAAALGRLGGGL